MLNRLIKVTICGKDYPINYSIRASRRLIALDTEIGKPEIVQDMDERTIKQLHVMMEDGAAYLEIFTGEKTDIPSLENLMIMLTHADCQRLVGKIQEAVLAGSGREVETAPSKKQKTALKEKALPGN